MKVGDLVKVRNDAPDHFIPQVRKATGIVNGFELPGIDEHDESKYESYDEIIVTKEQVLAWLKKPQSMWSEYEPEKAWYCGCPMDDLPLTMSGGWPCEEVTEEQILETWKADFVFAEVLWPGHTFSPEDSEDYCVIHIENLEVVNESR